MLYLKLRIVILFHLDIYVVHYLNYLNYLLHSYELYLTYLLYHQAYRLLTSYGKDKRRLENVHRIPAEGGVLSSVAVSIDQLVGIKWINPSLEKEAVAYALERHPKRGASVGAAPAAAAPPMPLKKRLLAARAAPPATRALPMHALPVSFFGSAPASVIAQR
jgi:hypothetical protein